MPRRVTRPWASARGILFALALTFATTAAVHAFLAFSTSEWWPAALAAGLVAAAAWCAASALDDR
ncbi:hypothetical protein SAXI111661_11955 [Saccharomonospora xinjiangensis]|uniref:hypothetical protein n=1 Tax=Saccharomonospora xinjiangensis TaxID=75294 RepID=UPI0010703327|nr:hypothetical protein [Saccharomonospora xinjiangensis]QBQ58639.1 hypothetical protein EYD13_01260 [Saccharomonospora xinjiangensis]